MKEISLLSFILLISSTLEKFAEPPMTSEKKKFIERWGNDYGYNGTIYELREK